jgi:hypothetical protein
VPYFGVRLGGTDLRSRAPSYHSQGPYHTTPAVPAQQQYPQGLAPALTPPFEGHQVPQGYTTMAPDYTVPGLSVQQRGQQSAPDGSGYHRSSTQQQYVAPISNVALHSEIQLASAYTPDHAIAPGAGDESSERETMKCSGLKCVETVEIEWWKFVFVWMYIMSQHLRQLAAII